jgi:hypothetical protein
VMKNYWLFHWLLLKGSKGERPLSSRDSFRNKKSQFWLILAVQQHSLALTWFRSLHFPQSKLPR